MYKGSEDADRKKKCCEQQLRRVDKALSRAGDIPEGSWICISHRNLILAEDKRCSMFLQFLAHTQTFDRGVHGSTLTQPVKKIKANHDPY